MRHLQKHLFAGVSPLLILSMTPHTAMAQPPANDELRAMLLELKQEQSALDARINKVEALLAQQTGLPAEVEGNAPRVVAITPTPPAAPNNQASTKPLTAKKLDVSGDLQLRYEGNFSDDDEVARNRGVMRGRLRANYKVNSVVTIGAELSTGDSNDPNTVHLTLSDFVDDFEVSLSRLYARFDWNNGVSVVGGKFANPFTRTDLVWDGDVNPQGAALLYSLSPTEALTIKTSGIYSIIDEASAGPDSDMIGGQLNFAFAPNSNWRFSSAVSYYDYSLDNLANADAGDFRANLRDGMGGYLSDFNLFNILASASYLGLGERWPVTINGDFVKNYGAAVSADEGFSTQISLGRSTLPGEWRIAYGYSQAEVDAVLGAFSHDNLGIATNYQSHLLGFDYTLFDNVALNATLYHYKPLDALYAGANDPDDWLDRLRLNMTVSF